MYIVINGGGKVGSALASHLVRRGNKVAIIERRPEICEKLVLEVPEALVIQGDGCDVKYLKEAGTDRADVFAAVTGDDDDNLVSCQLAKATFNVPRTVARVNNPKNERIFQALGIDGISSTTIIAQIIEEEASIGDIITLYVLKKGKLALVEVELPTTHCTVCEKTLSEIKLPKDCVIIAIIREGEVILPKGETKLESGDSVIALTSIEAEDELKRILTT